MEIEYLPNRKASLNYILDRLTMTKTKPALSLKLQFFGEIMIFNCQHCFEMAFASLRIHYQFSSLNNKPHICY